MTASGQAPLPMTLVLARRNPASLACGLASADAALGKLVGTLGDARTYRSGKRTDEARHQAKTVARQLRRLSRRVYTGPCGPARRHSRLGRYVSVHDRVTRDDGGLKTVAKEVSHIARALQRLGPWPGASILVRDSSGESTASRMGEIGQSLKAILRMIVLDVTAADLTSIGHLGLYGVRVIWSSSTVWPPGIARGMRASSREVGPGVFLA